MARREGEGRGKVWKIFAPVEGDHVVFGKAAFLGVWAEGDHVVGDRGLGTGGFPGKREVEWWEM